MGKNSEINEMWEPSMGHPKKEQAEAEKKALLNRMSRAIGHMESIKRMIEEDRDPTEILIQLAAVRSAISGASRNILQSHIKTCIEQAVDEQESGEELHSLDDLNKAISYFIK